MPKVKCMRVTAQWFIELCKGRETRRARPIAHALPDDAQFVDAKISERGTLFLIVMSESYPELPTGEQMPEQPATEFEVQRGKSAVDEDVLAAIREQIGTAETAYGEIVDPTLWKRLVSTT